MCLSVRECHDCGIHRCRAPLNPNSTDVYICPNDKKTSKASPRPKRGKAHYVLIACKFVASPESALMWNIPCAQARVAINNNQDPDPSRKAKYTGGPCPFCSPKAKTEPDPKEEEMKQMKEKLKKLEAQIKLANNSSSARMPSKAEVSVAIKKPAPKDARRPVDARPLSPARPSSATEARSKVAKSSRADVPPRALSPPPDSDVPELVEDSGAESDTFGVDRDPTRFVDNEETGESTMEADYETYGKAAEPVYADLDQDPEEVM